MSDVTFKPAEVFPFFPHSSLLKGEKEAIAAMVVSHLTANGNEWTEFSWKSFVEYIRDGNPALPPAYLGMFEGQLARATFGQIGVMVKEEFLIYRNDETSKVEYLKVGDKLLEFYKDYLQTAAA